MTTKQNTKAAPDAAPVAKPEPPGLVTAHNDKRAEAEAEFLSIQRRACELAGREMGQALEAIQRKYKVQLVVIQTTRNGQPLPPALQFEPAPLSQ